MIPSLWSSLPDDLIERVLACLPFPSFFRFRAVCKRWRFLAFSRGFLHLRSQVLPPPSASSSSSSSSSQPGSCFLQLPRCKCRALSSYEPRFDKWYTFPVGFLPAQASVPAAAAKGLLCFIATHYVDGYSILLVCNPLTKCWRVLPPMLYRRYPFLVSMVVDRKSRTYKIIVAGDYKSYPNRRSTEMYDSATCSWRLCGPVPQEEEISRSVVACNGNLFCLSRGPHRGLLAFSVQQGMWSKMKTGRLPGYSKFRHLVECRGRIMIVGKALRRQILGLYVWSLDSLTMKWRELGKMPVAISEQFFRAPSECFYCAAQGDMVFLSRFFCDQALIYNVVENSWQWVAGCPRVANPLVLPFEPGLDSVY